MEDQKRMSVDLSLHQYSIFPYYYVHKARSKPSLTFLRLAVRFSSTGETCDALRFLNPRTPPPPARTYGEHAPRYRVSRRCAPNAVLGTEVETLRRLVDLFHRDGKVPRERARGVDPHADDGGKDDGLSQSGRGAEGVGRGMGGWVGREGEGVRGGGGDVGRLANPV